MRISLRPALYGAGRRRDAVGDWQRLVWGMGMRMRTNLPKRAPPPQYLLYVPVFRYLCILIWRNVASIKLVRNGGQ